MGKKRQKRHGQDESQRALEILKKSTQTPEQWIRLKELETAIQALPAEQLQRAQAVCEELAASSSQRSGKGSGGCGSGLTEVMFDVVEQVKSEFLDKQGSKSKPQQKQQQQQLQQQGSVTHPSAEGLPEFRALLLVPRRDPVDPLMQKVCVSIMHDCDEISPEWLNVVKGVVVSEDLPLNNSLEKQNKIMRLNKKSLLKKGLEIFSVIAEKKDDYQKCGEVFGKCLMLGVPADAEQISSKEFIDRMKEGQYDIYCITEACVVAGSSPFLDTLRKQGLDVLNMVDMIDEFAVQQLKEVDGKKQKVTIKDDLISGNVDEKRNVEEFNAEFELNAEFEASDEDEQEISETKLHRVLCGKGFGASSSRNDVVDVITPVEMQWEVVEDPPMRLGRVALQVARIEKRFATKSPVDDEVLPWFPAAAEQQEKSALDKGKQQVLEGKRDELEALVDVESVISDKRVDQLPPAKESGLAGSGDQHKESASKSEYVGRNKNHMSDMMSGLATVCGSRDQQGVVYYSGKESTSKHECKGNHKHRVSDSMKNSVGKTLATESDSNKHSVTHTAGSDKEKAPRGDWADQVDEPVVVAIPRDVGSNKHHMSDLMRGLATVCGSRDKQGVENYCGKESTSKSECKGSNKHHVSDSMKNSMGKTLATKVLLEKAAVLHERAPRRGRGRPPRRAG